MKKYGCVVRRSVIWQLAMPYMITGYNDGIYLVEFMNIP